MTQTKDDYVERNKNFLTFHKFLDFKKAPMFYKLRYIDRVLPPLSNDALTFGSAFDEFLHDESVLESKYRVVGSRGVAVRSRKTKIETAGKKIEIENEKIKELPEIEDTEENKKEFTKVDKKRDKSLEKIKELKIDIDVLKGELAAMEGTVELTENMGEAMTSCLKELKRQPLYRRFPKARIEWEYRGHKIRGELDGLNLTDTEINGETYQGLMVDDKTCGSVDLLMRYLEQYKAQGRWYGWGLKNAKKLSFWDEKKGEWVADEEALEYVQGENFPFQINAVTKELPFPRSLFLFSSPDELEFGLDEMLAELDVMIDTIERDIFPVAPRDIWMQTDGYGHTDYDFQDSLMLF